MKEGKRKIIWALEELLDHSAVEGSRGRFLCIAVGGQVYECLKAHLEELRSDKAKLTPMHKHLEEVLDHTQKRRERLKQELLELHLEGDERCPPRVKGIIYELKALQGDVNVFEFLLDLERS